MTTEFVSVPSTWTIGETLQHIRKVERTRETIYAIYVLDPKTKSPAQGGLAPAPHDRGGRRTPCFRSRCRVSRSP